jgi:hypothetical protein
MTAILCWAAKNSLRGTVIVTGDNCSTVSRESGEEDLGARELIRRGYSAGPVFPTCITCILVGSVSSLGVWRCGLLLVLLLSGGKVQRSPLYRLPPCNGPPWLCPGCTGPAWYLEAL